MCQTKMSTKFNRPEVQRTIEEHCGCKNQNNWPGHLEKLINFKITTANESQLKLALNRDSGGFLYKGLVTLCEAISAVEIGSYSWSIVKFYYSIFYLNRASLGAKGYGLIRNKKWYLLRIREGETPALKNGDNFKNDHDAVINTYIQMYKDSDPLQSNVVDLVNPYKWLSERRNQVNYHQVSFYDPDAPDFMSKWKEETKALSFYEIISSYELERHEKSVKKFTPEHAWIAIPLLRANDVINEFKSLGLSMEINENQNSMLRQKLGGDKFLDNNLHSIIKIIP